MSKKRDVIMQHHELEELISPVQIDTGSPALLLSSDRYVAVGCDLRNTGKLDRVLGENLEVAKCLVLCVAEVSVTYMEVDAANALIRWAAQYDNGTNLWSSLEHRMNRLT